MKAKLLSFMLFFSFQSLIHGQERIRTTVFNITEIGAYFGSRDKLIKEEFHESVSDTHTAYIISFRNIRGWEFNRKFSLGLGIGYEGVIVKGAKNPDQLMVEGDYRYYTYKYTPGTYYHTIPIFGQAKYYFRKHPESAFIHSSLGSFLNLNRNVSKSLLLWGLGIGQRYKIGSGALFSIGIDFQERYLITSQNEKQRISGIGLCVGLLFN